MATTPCVGVCLIEDGRCTECNRTRQDISEWATMTEQERKERVIELQEYPSTE